MSLKIADTFNECRLFYVRRTIVYCVRPFSLMLYYFLRASIWEAFLMGERRRMTATVSYIKSFDFSVLQHCEDLAFGRANDKVRRNYNHVDQRLRDCSIPDLNMSNFIEYN